MSESTQNYFHSWSHCFQKFWLIFVFRLRFIPKPRMFNTRGLCRRSHPKIFSTCTDQSQKFLDHITLRIFERPDSTEKYVMESRQTFMVGRLLISLDHQISEVTLSSQKFLDHITLRIFQIEIHTWTSNDHESSFVQTMSDINFLNNFIWHWLW